MGMKRINPYEDDLSQDQTDRKTRQGPTFETWNVDVNFCQIYGPW